jgi:hypothetical protein
MRTGVGRSSPGLETVRAVVLVDSDVADDAADDAEGRVIVMNDGQSPSRHE